LIIYIKELLQIDDLQIIN